METAAKTTSWKQTIHFLLQLKLSNFKKIIFFEQKWFLSGWSSHGKFAKISACTFARHKTRRWNGIKHTKQFPLKQQMCGAIFQILVGSCSVAVAVQLQFLFGWINYAKKHVGVYKFYYRSTKRINSLRWWFFARGKRLRVELISFLWPTQWIERPRK